MVNLRNALPPGKLQSTIDGLKMHWISNLALFDVTADLRLGGVWSRALMGITPRNLVTPVIGLMLPPPVAPAAGFPLPQSTRPSPAAGKTANWRQ
jgi:hypothetical protein